MNLEHQQKLQTMKPTIDDDTEDDATGAERARLRAEVAAKREALVAAQKEHAHDFLTKVKSIPTVTDDWMDTEAAAVARGKMAAESQARKAAEQAKISAANKAMA